MAQKSDFLRGSMASYIISELESIAESTGHNKRGKDVFLRLWYSFRYHFYGVEMLMGCLTDQPKDYHIQYHFFENVKDINEFLNSLIKYKKKYGDIEHLVHDLIKQAEIQLQGLSRSYGYMPIPHKAKIIDQKTGEIKVNWEALAFMALNSADHWRNYWSDKFETEDGKIAVLIGYWQDIVGYYQVGNEVHGYRQKLGRWNNEGDIEEFKQRLRNKKVRGILLGSE